MELYVTILKPIDEVWDKKKVYKENEITLDTDWSGHKNDVYHVKLKSKSVYASMQQIKDYVLEHNPGVDMTSYSVQGLGRDYGGIDVYANDNTHIRLSQEEAESIKTEHIDTLTYTNVETSFSVDIGYEFRDFPFLKREREVYLTDELIEKFKVWFIKYWSKCKIDDLEGYLHDWEYDYKSMSIISVLQMVKILADKYYGIAMISIEK